MKNYIYVIKNEILQYFRHHKELIEISDTILVEESSESKIAASEELLLLFNEVISQMPEQRNKIFTMNRIAGMPYKEIASLLGISVKTVARHLEIARKEIKDFVDKNKDISIALWLPTMTELHVQT